jgi:hypothetical protein
LKSENAQVKFIEEEDVCQKLSIRVETMADREESVYMAKLAEQAVRRDGIEVLASSPRETRRVRGV